MTAVSALVSACLLGVRCRFDGEACPSGEVLRALEGGGEGSGRCRLVPVCPEILGGLPTPRARAEIRGGDGEDVLEGKARVICADGRDVTRAFLRGAEETLRLARLYGAEEAWLKARSPSCGVHHVYDGSFSGRLRCGRGVTAALLGRAGLRLRECD